MSSYPPWCCQYFDYVPFLTYSAVYYNNFAQLLFLIRVGIAYCNSDSLLFSWRHLTIHLIKLSSKYIYNGIKLHKLHNCPAYSTWTFITNISTLSLNFTCYLRAITHNVSYEHVQIIRPYHLPAWAVMETRVNEDVEDKTDEVSAGILE